MISPICGMAEKNRIVVFQGIEQMENASGVPPCFNYSKEALDRLSKDPYLCAQELIKLTAWITYERIHNDASHYLQPVMRQQEQILNLFQNCKFTNGV